MSTTTITLPEELNLRLTSAAERAGTTTHSLILVAISEKVDQAEKRHDFYELAENRYEKIVSTGKTISWDQMRRKGKFNMADNLVDLERRAAQLTFDARAQFASHLLESLEPIETGDINAVWCAEAESRLTQIERGETELLPAEQVFGNLKRLLT